MEANRQEWNERQQELRVALGRPEQHERAVHLFLCQHAMLHTSAVSNMGLHSFEDEVWDGLSEAGARAIPPGFEHSIAWNIWHLARIEDMTMNRLAAGTEQLFLRDGWASRLNVGATDTGNAMDSAAVTALSQAIDVAELRAYRAVVGRRTREIVPALSAKELKSKVQPARLAQIAEEGGVVPQASWLLEYWGGLTIAELLLMPPTRHCLVHLNECLRIRRKIV